MRRETELNSPRSVAEVVGICVICAGTTVWEQKEKACISEASFTIKSSILWIHPLLKHPIQPAWCYSTPGLVFVVFLTILLCVFYSFYIFSQVYVCTWPIFLCFYQLSCLVSYFFSLSFSFSSVFLAYCVLLASFQLCSSIRPHSISQGSLCS